MIKEQENRNQISVGFGETFTPFAGINIEEKLISSTESMVSDEFHLNGVGTIHIELNSQLALEDLGVTTHMVSKSETGEFVLTPIPSDLYQLEIVVYFDDSRTVDPKISCTMKVENLEISCNNSEEKDPEHAGGAFFINWGNDEKEPFANILIPADYINCMQIKLDKPSSTAS